MFVTTPRNRPQYLTLAEWADMNKTIIVLNGGANQDIQEKFLFLSRSIASASWSTPVSAFSEDDASLGGVMTCCGLIVPERIWGALSYRSADALGLAPPDMNREAYLYKDADGKITITDPTDADYGIMTMIKNSGLAR
jgi:hypothetical protein